MGVGTSLGAYYDDEFHYHQSQWNPMYDNNVIDPDTTPDLSASDKNLTENKGPLPVREVSDKEPLDYDYAAWSKANPGVKMEPGQHYPDTYKLPNHMTFSDESIYHGKDGNLGGHWGTDEEGNDTFTPGPTNLKNSTPEQLQDYFKRVEPGVKLIMPPGGPTEPAGALKSTEGSQTPPAENSSPESPDRRSIRQKLMGEFGDRYKLWPERLARGIYDSAVSALTAPGDAYAGRFDPNSEEGVRRAMDMAGWMVGAPAPVASKLADGTLGSFAGVGAKTADKSALDVAKIASEQGFNKEEIYRSTGWFKGADGQWKFEISDKGSKLNKIDLPELKPTMNLSEHAKLGDYLDHSELFNAYPEMKNIGVVIDPARKGGASFETSSDGRAHRILLGPDLATGKGLNDTKGVILHELQHYIQRQEGFAKGGSAVDNSAASYNNYRRIAGEAEAHNVQTRADFGDFTREKLPPWRTESPSAEHQVVSFESLRAHPDRFETGGGQTIQALESPKGPEKIKSPALQYKGETVEGFNHGFALGDLMDKYGDIEMKHIKDGFTTTHGRFVSREEAFRIAKEHEQMNENVLPALTEESGMLLSEDLKDFNPAYK